jgi:3-oxoacyl-[acyl-carrier protein] reductase
MGYDPGISGKVAVITGASRGIGRAISLALASHGAIIVADDVVEEPLLKLVAEIESAGGKAAHVVADVSKFADGQRIVDFAVERFDRIDILVNNAGITRDSLLMRMNEEDWDKVISVNLKGVFNCTRAAARQMFKQRSGRIVNISSVSGLMGTPGQANYAASKAGIVAFTKSAARELGARGVTVNAIAPGFIEGEMTSAMQPEWRQRVLEEIPMKRAGTPDDVAKAVVFLCSSLADYVTGTVLIVDGGLSR